jgi:hypothetical protein
MASFYWNDVDPRYLLPKHLQSLSRDIAPETVDSFRKGLEGEFILEDKLNLSKPYKVLSIEEHGELFGQDIKAGWEDFYERYKRSVAIVTVSRPGISQDGT